MSAPDPMLVPALKASMGDWAYYIGFMSMGDIVERVSVAEDIHVTQSLRDWLQRRLTQNSKKIADYLLTQEQRFFNGIVVGAYGGKPRWHEVAIQPKDGPIPSRLEGAHGFLELRGDEVLFAVDGQHRVKGMQAAIAKNAALKDEEVCTIFVKGVTANQRTKDPAGFERIRRLFATLNRYAKPVQKRDIIALDEDDVVAIVTRRLVEEHPLFVDKTAMRAGKSVVANDDQNITSIVALYDFLDVCLRDKSGAAWNDYKRFRPQDSEVEQWYGTAAGLWDDMCRSFRELRVVRDSEPEQRRAGNYRNRETGGHLLFRPVGLLALGRAIRHWGLDAVTPKTAIRRLARVPMLLSEAPWAGLLWDTVNHRMIPEAKQAVVGKVLFHASGGDLSLIKSAPTDLQRELAGLLNREPADIELRVFAR